MKRSVASIKLLGWRHELMAANPAGTLQDVSGGLGTDSVVLSLNPELYRSLVPDTYWGESLVTVSVEELPSSVTAVCRPPKNLKDSLPESIKGQEFPVLVERREELQPAASAVTPEQMRDEFFALGDSLRELARFANKWGEVGRYRFVAFLGRQRTRH